MTAVGKKVSRIEGVDKVTGAARYIDDLTFPGMLHGRTVRSSIPHGVIRSIVFDSAFDWTGFTTVTHHDIPGQNVVALIDIDQPCLAVQRIRHPEEPILLVAHEDRERVEEAVRNIRVNAEAYEPVLTIDQSLSKEEILYGTDNVFKRITIAKGDLETGMREADTIVEGVYRTGHQEHVYIETNGVIAVPENDGITVYGSIQCPYFVHRALKTLLALPEERVRVVQTVTGGGFGGKEEYPSMLAGHAALLALKSKRPVKIVYDRLEDLVATTKRHPSRIRHRTGVKRDGRITAIEIDLILDGGAYVTLSPVVLSRAAIHATGPYRCEHVRIEARAVATNTPPNGAFRGFGAPQAQFAAEVHMDRIARAIGMDPVKLREVNALREGDITATGQVLRESVSALDVLREAVKRSNYHALRKRGGVGVALFWHGSGFTGGGEVKLASKAALEVTKTGVKILVASTEIGQGTRTMHAQIVADTLGLPFDWIETMDPDTALVPDSGPTVASRTCMIVGRILQNCAVELRARLRWKSPGEFRKLAKKHAGLKITKAYEKPAEIQWDDATYRGDAYGAYGWGCVVAPVEVDAATHQVRPLPMTVVCEIGKAIHPVLAEGQVAGGTAQGIGWALLEEVVLKNGRMANGQLTNYIIPTTLDTPAMKVTLLEKPYAHGPFGAKGIGEMPIDGPAPALVNAINHALGTDLASIPATPERIFEAVRR